MTARIDTKLLVVPVNMDHEALFSAMTSAEKL